MASQAEWLSLGRLDLAEEAMPGTTGVADALDLGGTGATRVVAVGGEVLTAGPGLGEGAGCGLSVGSALAGWDVVCDGLVALLVACDPLLLLSEAMLALALCMLGSPLLPLVSYAYTLLVSFCLANGVSAYEVGGLLTTMLGLALFDLFAAASEEDLADMASGLILCFIG